MYRPDRRTMAPMVLMVRASAFRKFRNEQNVVRFFVVTEKSRSEIDYFKYSARDARSTYILLHFFHFVYITKITIHLSAVLCCDIEERERRTHVCQTKPMGVLPGGQNLGRKTQMNRQIILVLDQICTQIITVLARESRKEPKTFWSDSWSKFSVISR